MNSVLHTIHGVISWPRTVYDGVWLFFDIWFGPFGNVIEPDRNRLRQVQRDERDIRGKIVIVTGSNSGENLH